MYKDKDKQREANRLASQRKRDKLKGVTADDVKSGFVIPYTKPRVIPIIPKRGKDIKCFADLPEDVQLKINRQSLVDNKIDETIKANRTAIAINYQHLFPESFERGCMEITRAEAIVIGKPGDADYNGVCTDEWRAERGR